MGRVEERISRKEIRTRLRQMFRAMKVPFCSRDSTTILDHTRLKNTPSLQLVRIRFKLMEFVSQIDI